MANNPIIPKRNSVAGAAAGPNASALQVGEIAVNTFTGKLYVKKEDNSVAEVSGSGASGFDRQLITASAGQTVFDLTDLTYTPGAASLCVYRNGLKLVSGSDYTETNESRVTLTAPATAGDELEFIGGIALNGESTSGSLVSFTPAGTGAVARTVQDKLREIVSVKDFGAVGDGVSDDTVAIQAAISAGNDVYFPKGTYKVVSEIVISTDNQQLYGDRDAILKRFAAVAIFKITGNGNLIRGLRFDGNKAFYPYPTYARSAALWIQGDFNVIHECYVDSSNSHGILFSTGGAANNNLVDGCTILNCDEVGIAHDGGTDNRIVNNHISGSGYEGITLDQSSYRCIVDGNRINANGVNGGVGGIGIDQTDLCVISNNIISGTQSGLSGITFQNNIGPSNLNVISGNVFDSNAGYAICLKTNTGGSASSNSITGNVFRNNNVLGSVKIESGCQGNVFAGNYYGAFPDIDPASYNNLEAGLIFFRATNTVVRADVTGNNTQYQIPFNALVNERNASSAFNISNGIFTAPATGIYSFSAACRTTGGSVADFSVLSIVTSAGTLTNGSDYTDKPNQNMCVSGSIILQKGQTAYVTIRVGGEATNIIDVAGDASQTYFTGVLIG